MQRNNSEFDFAISCQVLSSRCVSLHYYSALQSLSRLATGDTKRTEDTEDTEDRQQMPNSKCDDKMTEFKRTHRAYRMCSRRQVLSDTTKEFHVFPIWTAIPKCSTARAITGEHLVYAIRAHLRRKADIRK